MIESAPLFLWMSILVIYVRSHRPDLTNMQIATLLIIHMIPGPHFANDLASRLQASKSSVSKAVLRLVALGYVQQAPVPHERSLQILPTQKGIAFLDELKRAVEPALKSSAAKPHLRGLMRDLDLLGDGFRTAFPLPDKSAFDDLLAAIDRAS